MLDTETKTEESNTSEQQIANPSNIIVIISLSNFILTHSGTFNHYKLQTIRII